jgi:hypothetical protein
MSHAEFARLLQSVDTLSPVQMWQLRQELDLRLAPPETETEAGSPANDDESRDMELQRRMLEAGLLSEIKPPITDLTPYRDRKAVPIQGEPLSETIIRERR